MAIQFALSLLVSSSIFAGGMVNVTAVRGFADGINRVAIVLRACPTNLDCDGIAATIAETVHIELPHKMDVIGTNAVRESILELGRVNYSSDLMLTLSETLAVDAFLEVEIDSPARERFSLLRAPEAYVHVQLVRPDGQLLMAGHDAVSTADWAASPERVVDRSVKAMLNNAFSRSTATTRD